MHNITRKKTQNTWYAVILLLLFACTSQKDKPNPVQENKVYPLTGTWLFKNPDFAAMELIFNKDSTVLITDVEFKSIGTYIVNMQTDPIQLDIVWPDLGLVKTIIRFIDKDTLQLENNNVDTERAAAFSSNSEILIRKKE